MELLKAGVLALTFVVGITAARSAHAEIYAEECLCQTNDFTSQAVKDILNQHSGGDAQDGDVVIVINPSNNSYTKYQLEIDGAYMKWWQRSAGTMYQANDGSGPIYVPYGGGAGGGSIQPVVIVGPVTGDDGPDTDPTIAPIDKPEGQ